jgi:ribonuclease D
MMAVCRVQGRIKDIAYLHHIYHKVKNRIQEENQVIQSDQDVHIYGCDEHGKVNTRSEMGARYYHI